MTANIRESGRLSEPGQTLRASEEMRFREGWTLIRYAPQEHDKRGVIAVPRVRTRTAASRMTRSVCAHTFCCHSVECFVEWTRDERRAALS